MTIIQIIGSAKTKTESIYCKTNIFNKKKNIIIQRRDKKENKDIIIDLN